MKRLRSGGTCIDCVVPGAVGRGRPGDRLLAGEVAAGDRAVGLHDLVVVGGAAQQVVAGRLEGDAVAARPRGRRACRAAPRRGGSRRSWRCRGGSAATSRASRRARRCRTRAACRCASARPATLRARAVDVERAERAERRVGDRPVGGQLREARAAARRSSVKPYRSSDAVPPTTSSPGRPSTSPTEGPVRNSRSLTGLGQPGRNWPVAVS